jgi:hypothetical protein
MNKPDFNFFIPIEADSIEKSTSKGGKYKDIIVSGMASDASVDSDEEVLMPNGFQLDRFLKLGWVNYDHRAKDSSKYLIGEPVEAKVENNKFFIKAKLFGENPIARDVVDTMKMLKKSGSNRKIGWSIEGRALERDPQNQKKVTKALITGVAITPNPKNGNSYADIVKGEYSTPYVSEYQYQDDIEKSVQDTHGGKITYLVDITDQERGIRYTIDKDLNLKVEKAISTETAKPLIKEDLERKLKVLPFGTNDIKNIVTANKNGQIGEDLMVKVREKIKEKLK